VDSKGFWFYTATNPIKRHLAVEPLGFPFFSDCTRANVCAQQGLLEMLKLNSDYFKAKPVNIAKLTILLDHGYHPDDLTQELQKIYPQIMTKIRFERSTKPSKQKKAEAWKVGICSSSRSVGEANEPMLGWSAVKVRLKTLSAP
jgi:hypothetical protein